MQGRSSNSDYPCAHGGTTLPYCLEQLDIERVRWPPFLAPLHIRHE
jgi:hypothetical protein